MLSDEKKGFLKLKAPYTQFCILQAIVGPGFPTKKMFLDEVIPLLNLNVHNPEFIKDETPISGGWFFDYLEKTC